MEDDKSDTACDSIVQSKKNADDGEEARITKTADEVTSGEILAAFINSHI